MHSLKQSGAHAYKSDDAYLNSEVIKHKQKRKKVLLLIAHFKDEIEVLGR